MFLEVVGLTDDEAESLCEEFGGLGGEVTGTRGRQKGRGSFSGIVVLAAIAMVLANP